MGRRGPAPKPTALRVLEGNPSHRPLPSGEPKPLKGRPKCPSWLSREAKRTWRELVPQLEAMGLLTRADGHLLAIYCETWAEYRAAVEYLREYGTVYDAGHRGVIARPEVGVAQKARVLLRQYAQEFGLTPSARGRLVVPKSQAEDAELEALLNGG